jgi:hypothetical protein
LPRPDGIHSAAKRANMARLPSAAAALHTNLVLE